MRAFNLWEGTMKRLMAVLSNNPPAQDSRELSRHFSATYFSLRVALAALAFALPLVLWLYGKYAYGLDLRASMSAYFWAAADGSQCASFPMRTLFVGFLFAIAVCLYAYKGLTPLENTLLNLAAICAFLVALFPERLAAADAGHDPKVEALFATCPAVRTWAGDAHWPIHFPAAIILFVLLAAVAWFCANKSLDYLPARYYPAVFRRMYKGIAVAMVLFPVTGIVVAYVLGAASDWIFFIEAAGVVTFAIYWTVKTAELALSSLEYDPEMALEGIRQSVAGLDPASPAGCGE
jgi:hypothetical protein